MVIPLKYDYILADSTKIEARESLHSLRTHQISILGAAQAVHGRYSSAPGASMPPKYLFDAACESF